MDRIINIFIDDERIPSEVFWINIPNVDYTIIRTQKEFEETLINHGLESINHISFDNDLGDGFGEGIFCVDFIIEKVLDKVLIWNPNLTWTIHSKNNIAAKLMENRLDDFKNFIENNC